MGARALAATPAARSYSNGADPVASARIPLAAVAGDSVECIAAVSVACGLSVAVAPARPILGVVSRRAPFEFVRSVVADSSIAVADRLAALPAVASAVPEVS